MRLSTEGSEQSPVESRPTWGPVRPLALLALLAVVVLAALGATAGCKRSSGTVMVDPGDTPITVKPDSEGLLLTWIDDKGDFQVQTRVADVPMIGRDSVRVVDPNKDEGTHADRVFVADLREPRADGTFPVRVMTRADFEAIAVARREKTGPTLASAGPRQPPPSPTPGQTPAQTSEGDGTQPANTRPAVIIYGAEWCGACHDAARYLRSKGIAYIEKDVEKDPGAAREMQQKLAHNGLHSGSIPVIDVRGRVMVGFNAHEVDDALGQAL